MPAGKTISFNSGYALTVCGRGTESQWIMKEPQRVWSSGIVAVTSN